MERESSEGETGDNWPPHPCTGCILTPATAGPPGLALHPGVRVRILKNGHGSKSGLAGRSLLGQA